MTKCPFCKAFNSPLVRICEYCSRELPATASPVASSEPTEANQTNQAGELCAETQDALAQLAARWPASGPMAFLIGFLTLPTLGLALLLFRTFKIFASVGRSDNRLWLAIDQNLRALELAYKADPGVRELIAKANRERADYLQRQQASARAFWLGLGTALALIVVICLAAVGYWHYQHQKAEQAEATARQQAALAAAYQASQNHATAQQLTSAVKSDAAYKAVILVENFTEIDNNNIPVLENLLSSKRAGFGFAIVDQDSVARAVASQQPPGPPPAGSAASAIDNILAVTETAVAFARELNANYIIHATINSYGHETTKFTGYGVATDNYKYTLSVAYKLIETGEGGAIKGGTVEATKTIRVTDGAQVETTDLINGLLEDAAGQIAQVIDQIRPKPQSP